MDHKCSCELSQFERCIKPLMIMLDLRYGYSLHNEKLLTVQEIRKNFSECTVSKFRIRFTHLTIEENQKSTVEYTTSKKHTDIVYTFRLLIIQEIRRGTEELVASRIQFTRSDHSQFRRFTKDVTTNKPRLAQRQFTRSDHFQFG